MSTMKKFLAASVAALAFSAGAANAATTSTATTYIAGGTPPATISIAAVVVNATDDAPTTGTAYTTLFTNGNTVTFTLSQGTFAGTPVPTVSGVTATLLAGGASSNFVTYTLSGVGATPSVTLPASTTVAGITDTGDGAAITVTVTSNVAALNNLPAALRRANGATFSAGVTSTLAAAANSGNVYSASAGFFGAQPQQGVGSLGTATFTPVTGLLNYTGGAVTFGTPTYTLNIPYTAGSLSNLSVGAGCVGATTLASNVIAASQTLTGAAALTAACTLAPTIQANTTNAPPADLVVTPLTSAVAASGPTSVVATVPVVNGPAGLSSITVTRALSPIVYTGNVVNLNYVVGDDANYGFFVNVTNNGTSAFRPVVCGGGFCARFASTAAVPAGGSRLYSVAEISAVLTAAGASSSLFANSSSRAQLTFTTPAGNSVTPLLLNKASGLVTQVGGGFNNP